MDQLQQFIGRGRAITYGLLVISNIVLLSIGILLSEYFELAPTITLAALGVAAIVLPFTVLWVISSLFTKPLRLLSQAIMYLAPMSSGIAAPKLDTVKLGKTLTTNLVNQIYQLADTAREHAPAVASQANFVADHLPLPLIIFDKQDTVVYANAAFTAYRQAGEAVTGKNVNDVLPLSFTSDDTLDAWLAGSRADRATSTRIWERIRLGEPTDIHAPLADLVAYYNKDNPSGYETMLLLFDRTERYSQDDEAVGFVAMAVHELRTPLTMLRGYIEALEEELDGKLDEELSGFMQKMQTSAQQLATFVNNILNVARVEDGQMFLRLNEERWQDVLASTIDDLTLRAKIRGITIKTDIDPNLPTAAVDRICLYQVVSNLVDNAIKYSGQSKEIIISAKLNSSGAIETTVQDFGAGIPESAVPHLFEKFYRDHHNRSQVGGTGLGLFLCKTFIAAHGGNIWVRSKEGTGSTFGFTLLPYADLASELKNSDNTGIVRGAHGWIKNHSLYRG